MKSSGQFETNHSYANHRHVATAARSERFDFRRSFLHLLSALFPRLVKGASSMMWLEVEIAKGWSSSRWLSRKEQCHESVEMTVLQKILQSAIWVSQLWSESESESFFLEKEYNFTFTTLVDSFLILEQNSFGWKGDNRRMEVNQWSRKHRKRVLKIWPTNIPLSKTKLVSHQTFGLKSTCLSRTRRLETLIEAGMKRRLLGLEHHRQQM